MFKMKLFRVWLPVVACALMLNACSNDDEKVVPTDPGEKDTAPYDTTLYLRGGFNNWEAKDAFTYTGQRVFELATYLSVDDYTFKIADDAWSADWTFSGNALNASEVKLDTDVDLVRASGLGNDLQLSVATAGYYHFSFTVPEDTSAAHKLMVTLDTAPYDTNLFVRGSFNGWGSSSPLTYKGNRTYSAVLNLSAETHEFKIGDTDWSADYSFTGSKSGLTKVQLNTPAELVSEQGMGNNLQFVVTDAGMYTFTFVVPEDTTQAPLLTLTEGGDNSDVIANRELLDLTLDAGVASAVALKGAAAPIKAPNTLFDLMAITDSKPMNFVFGDNVDGYYSGRTNVFSGGGKYNLKTGWLLGSFASYVDGNLNDRVSATSTSIMPYGSLTNYANNSHDDLSLLSGYRAMALHVNADAAATLAIVPQLNLELNNSTVERSDNIVVYAVAKDLRSDNTPAYVAIAADQPVSYKEVTFADMPELGSKVLLDGANIKPLISTAKPATDLTVYVAFAFSAEEAANLAQKLVTENGRMLHQQKVYDRLTKSYLWSNDTEYNRALLWSKIAGYQMLTTEFGDGIWAGLPWFKDNWGRDTFIALPGTTLVNGDFDIAKAIIDNFATLQNTDTQSKDYGRIPNRVTSLDNIIYNTTDGTPWMVREVGEYLRYTGDTEYAAAIYPVVKLYLEGALSNYVDADGLLTHEAADTWMDAQIDGSVPWSARGSRAVDIQALWFSALQVAADLADLTGATADAVKWRTQATAAKTAFLSRFWDNNNLIMADRIRDDNTADIKVRPNQLMTISVPLDADFIDDAVGAQVMHKTVSELLFPYGITSLSQHDQYFHPYHDGRTEYAKDSAYHNGTIWGWNAGFTVTSLVRFGEQEHAYALTKNLGEQILNLGYRGTMSEVLDAFPDGDVKVTTGGGTFTQAWSVSEYNRNGYQDYVGFRPDLIHNTLQLNPALPASWSKFDAVLPFGDGDKLSVTYSYTAGSDSYTLVANGITKTLTLAMELTSNDSSKIAISTAISNDQSLLIVHDRNTNKVTINGSDATVETVRADYRSSLGALKFATPELDASYPMLNTNNALRTIIEAGDFQ